MAYIPQIPENEQNAQAPTGQTTPNPIGNLPPVTTGGSAGQATGGTAGGGTSAAGSSTQFAAPASKLSDYLKTNAPLVAQQGQNIASGLTDQYNTAQGNINSAVGGFGQQVQGGYAAANPDLAKQAAENPTQFVSNPENVKGFQSLWNDQYTGPQNFESTDPYKTVQGEVQNAVSQAQNIQTPGGLQSYFNNQAQGTYLPGMATLDTALIGGNPEAVGAIQNAVRPYSGLTNYLGNQVTQANALVPQAQQAAQAAQQGIRNQFTGTGGVIPTYQNTLQNQTTAAQQQAQSAIDTEKALLSGNWQGIQPSGLPDLGINQEQYYNLLNQQNRLGGTAPSWDQYFNAINPTVDINQANVATPQQYSDIAALQQLTGQDLSGLLSQENLGQAGTAPTDYYNLNYGQMNTDLQNLINNLPTLPTQPPETPSEPKPSILEPIDNAIGQPGGTIENIGSALPDVTNKVIDTLTSPITNNIPGTSDIINPITNTIGTIGNPVNLITNPVGSITDIGKNAIDLTTAPLDLVTGGEFSNIVNQIGGGNTGVSNQWNEAAIPTVDPLIQYIAQTRGAPHGKDPGKWWSNTEEMTNTINNYIYSLPENVRKAYLANFDPAKLSADMAKVYGQGYDFTPWTKPAGLAPGTVRMF